LLVKLIPPTARSGRAASQHERPVKDSRVLKAVPIRNARLIARSRRQVDLEAKPVLSGIEQPELGDARLKVRRWQTLRILANRFVADNLNHQIRGAFQLDGSFLRNSIRSSASGHASEPPSPIDRINGNSHTTSMDEMNQPKPRWFQFRLRTLLIAVFVLSVLLSGLAVIRVARTRTAHYKRSEHAEKVAGKYRRTIQSEIQKPGSPPWAGEYYRGDGLGENTTLMLAPASGCLFEWRGCVGLYDRNYGAVTCSDGRLRLSLKLPNDQDGFVGIEEEFLPVVWGERKYLVPSDDIVGFCNAVNEGAEPRKAAQGFFLLRRGDEQIEAEGLPAVPNEFNPYLLTRPIEAEIVRVGDRTARPIRGDWQTRVTMNCGRSSGLLKGMTLHVIEPDDLIESVDVTQVGEEQSEAVMTQSGEDEPSPKVGWQLSTRCRWYQDL
jgi:hypothetical protein